MKFIFNFRPRGGEWSRLPEKRLTSRRGKVPRWEDRGGGYAIVLVSFLVLASVASFSWNFSSTVDDEIAARVPDERHERNDYCCRRDPRIRVWPSVGVRVSNVSSVIVIKFENHARQNVLYYIVIFIVSYTLLSHAPPRPSSSDRAFKPIIIIFPNFGRNFSRYYVTVTGWMTTIIVYGRRGCRLRKTINDK